MGDKEVKASSSTAFSIRTSNKKTSRKNIPAVIPPPLCEISAGLATFVESLSLYPGFLLSVDISEKVKNGLQSS